MKRIGLGNSRNLHFMKYWFLGGAASLLAVSLESLPIVAYPSQVLTLPLQPAITAQSQTAQQNSSGLKMSSQASRVDRPTLKQGSQGETVSELQAALKLLGFYPGNVDGVYGEQTAQAVSRFQSAAGLEADGITGMDTWNRLFPPTPKISAPTTSANLAQTTPAPAAPELPPASAPVVQTTAPIVDTTSPSPIPANRPASPQPTKSPSTGGTATVSPVVKPPTQSGGAASEPNAQVSLPTLRKGMRGPAVTHLQERLKALGVFKGAIDGVFGAETETAVKAAQRNRNLSPDGVVGPMTWSALLR
jgi:peptidoglycan hydrolase-like protein with peptidoglycan-binding domain